MILQEAKTLAQTFLDQYNAPISRKFDIKYGIGAITEFTDCYFFEMIFLHLNGTSYITPPVASSQVGFIISKNEGKAKVITCVDLHRLEKEEKRMDDLFALLTGIRENNDGLNVIKSRYQLSSKELLLFSRELQQITFNRLTVTDKLQELINKIKK